MKEITTTQPILNIETIKGPNGGEVFYCPERGGIITSLKLNGKEVLYLDEETFRDLQKNVKGGVPILFPNAGPIAEGSEFSNLPQHGFARNKKWQAEKAGGGFSEILSADEETMEAFPYNFRFSVLGRYEENGSFTMNQEVENKEIEKELPLSMGLHPYFRIPGEEDSDTKKRNIRFNFEGGKSVEEQVETWANGKAVSIDNPKIKDPNAVIEVNIPSLGTLIIDASAEYRKIWIWSMPGKDFICIEPVMRNKNGLIDDPEKIKPGQTFSANVNFRLKE